MSYIESHQDLEDHPKFLDLRAALGLDTDTAIGRLTRFWWWCLKYAETGSLEKHPPARIDAKFGAGWADAMRTAGFIDQNRFRIHDWPDYAGRYLKTRYRTKKPVYLASIFLEYGRRDEAVTILTAALEYKTAARITQAQMDVCLGLLPTPENAIKPLKGSDPGQTQVASRAQKGPTWVKAPQLNSTQLSAAQPTSATPLPPQGACDQGAMIKRPEQPLAASPGGFDAFMDLHPHPVNRKAAQRAWTRINPGPDLEARILAALRAQIAGPVWAEHIAKKRLRFITHPTTWLKDERWNDEVPVADPGRAAASVEGPPQGSPYQPRTPLQRLTCCYKLLKGVAMDDPGWDASNWAGAEPSAQHLLAAFDGADQTAAVWLEGYAQEMERLDRKNWTLRSAAARAWDTKGERQEPPAAAVAGVIGADFSRGGTA